MGKTSNKTIARNAKKKALALDAIKDLAINWLYYDRKEDEDLSTNDLRKLIETEQLTMDEIVNRFSDELTRMLKE